MTPNRVIASVASLVEEGNLYNVTDMTADASIYFVMLSQGKLNVFSGYYVQDRKDYYVSN
jgi:hypothetical protein